MATEATASRLATLVIVICVGVLAGTVAVVLSPSLRQTFGLGPAPVVPAYEIGGRVDVDPAIYQTADSTLILFARSTCTACQEGQTFFARALAAGHASGRGTAMVAPVPELAAEAGFGAALGLAPNQIHGTAPGSIKLRAVPALMVVDRSGTIVHAWFGLPDEVTQDDILRALSLPEGGHDS